MMDVNVASMFLTCRAVVPVMREQGGGQDREHLVGHAVPRRPVPPALRDVARARSSRSRARSRRSSARTRSTSTASRPASRCRDGVKAHPEVDREAARRLGRVADDPARPGARGRRRRRRLPLHAGRRLHHRPDDGHRRRPVLPLSLVLSEHPGGVETEPGRRSSYDLERNEAHFGAARIDGPARRLGARGRARAPASGSCAATASTSRRAGSRTGTCTRAAGSAILLTARSRSTAGTAIRARTRPGEAWFEGADDPVLATASRDRGHGVRPRAAAPGRVGGARTIRYVDPADEDKPRLQRATVLLEVPRCEERRPDPRRPARAERRRPRVLRPGRELPARARRALRLADPADHVPPRAGRGERGGGVRKADRPARALPRHARARARRRRRSASTPRSRTRRR